MGEPRPGKQRILLVGDQPERAIAERTRTDEVLWEAERMGRDLLKNLGGVIHAIDCDGVVTFVSPAVESFIGFQPSEASARHLSEFIFAEDRTRLSENFQRVLFPGHARRIRGHRRGE